MPIPGSVLNLNLPFGISAVGNLFESRATLRPLTITTDSTGQENHAFVDSVVAGQFNLPCRKSPLILVRPQGQESKNGDIQRTNADFQVYFQTALGILPETLDTWQVKVDGVVYQILSTEGDGSGLVSRLVVAIITPYTA